MNRGEFFQKTILLHIGQYSRLELYLSSPLLNNADLSSKQENKHFALFECDKI